MSPKYCVSFFLFEILRFVEYAGVLYTPLAFGESRGSSGSVMSESVTIDVSLGLIFGKLKRTFLGSFLAFVDLDIRSNSSSFTIKADSIMFIRSSMVSTNIRDRKDDKIEYAPVPVVVVHSFGIRQ